MENENTITLVDENGNETLCEVLFTFHSDNFNKDYVVFALPVEDDEEEQEVGAASYHEKDGGVGDLEEIETEEEWAEIEEMLSSFLDDECDCCDCEDCEECDDENCECHHHHE